VRLNGLPRLEDQDDSRASSWTVRAGTSHRGRMTDARDFAERSRALWSPTLAN
jgi:hypothetical protein